MNDHCVIGQAGTLKTGENRTDALINERNKAEVFLFKFSIIVDRETKLKLTYGSAFILGCSVLLPFTGQPVSQRKIVPWVLESCRIDIHLVNRMFIIKRTIVRRMRFDEGHHQNKRISPIPLNEFACVLLDKSGLRQLKR